MLAQLTQANGFYPWIFDIQLFQVLETLYQSELMLMRSSTEKKVGVLLDDETAIVLMFLSFRLFSYVKPGVPHTCVSSFEILDDCNN